MPLGTSLRLQTPLRGCPLARETKVQTREAERCPRSRGAGDLAWAQNHTPSAGGHGGHGCRSGSHLEPWDPRWGLKTLGGTTAPAPITLLPSRAAGWVLGTPGLVAELGKQRTPRKQAQTRGPRQSRIQTLRQPGLLPGPALLSPERWQGWIMGQNLSGRAHQGRTGLGPSGALFCHHKASGVQSLS